MAMRIGVAIEERAEGLVATVTVAHAAKLNIVGTAAVARLAETFQRLSGEALLRAVVLRGEGERAFIGGADIVEMATLDVQRGRAFIAGLHAAMAAIRACPVPVIARLQGWALGGGMEIAAACDLRVAGVGARFGMPEVRMGIPSVIEAALLPMLIGWGRTRRLLLTGEIIDAPTALAWGFVEEVAEDVDAAIGRVVADILAGGPLAVRPQKALMAAWEELTPAGAIQPGIDSFAASWASPEPGERMAAFLAAKRKPATTA